MTTTTTPNLTDIDRDLDAPVTFDVPVPGVLERTTIDTPIGQMLLTSDGQSLNGLHLARFDAILARSELKAGADAREVPDSPIFAEAARQLAEYFAGERRAFDLPLAPIGTDFQRQVWAALTTIPYGTTAGYGELAGWLHRPQAARAVGAANGKNPISVIVPCHRVIGANGSLTGYEWGEEMKRTLLDFEAGRGTIE